MCWYTHGEPFVYHKTMVKWMVGSTSSASNMHGIVDDNSNFNRNIVMDVIRMNQGHVVHCPIILDEESNADTTRFFFF
jgi:hypothetical protein